METTFSATSLNQNASPLATTSLSGGTNLLANSNPLDISNSSSFSGRSSSQPSSGSSAIGGNIITGDGEWVIKGIDQKRFASLVQNTLDNFTSTIFDRLNDKYISENGDQLTSSAVIKQNPFANGNNPFGEGNQPVLPALDFLKSQYGENFPLPSGNASDLASGVSDNPFGGGANPVTGGGSSAIGLAGDNSVVVTGDGSGNPLSGGANPGGDGSSTIAIAASPDSPNAGSTNPLAAGGSGGGSNPLAAGGSGGGTNPLAAGGSGGGSNPLAAGGSGGSSNPLAAGGSGGGSNPLAAGGSGSSSNPFASGGSGGMGNPLDGTSNFDITSILGDTSKASDKEILSKVLDFTLDFAGSLNSMGSNSPVGSIGGNDSPLKTPSDLLRLYRSDMTAFGLTVDSFTNFTGENNPFAGTSNPFAGSQGSGGLAEQEARLTKFLGWALDGLLPFTGRPNVFQTNEGELPLGYGNRDFGTGNAVIGNANRDYGKNNGSIGNNNWNWDSTTNNASVGSGNFNFGSENKTVGNANFSLDNSNDNNTFGNGNWNIGSGNSTLGNGNYNFGNNNLVIGNGNKVFTSNSIVIGNGNWSVVMENNATNLASISTIVEKMNTLSLGTQIKGVVDNLVDTTVKKMGNLFYGLTKDFDQSQKQTFDNVIRQKDTYSLQNPFASLASI
jgi:hypothetical protein